MVKVRRIRDTSKQAANLSWVPVTGPDGRIRMEMRWHVPSKKATGSPSHAA